MKKVLSILFSILLLTQWASAQIENHKAVPFLGSGAVQKEAGVGNPVEVVFQVGSPINISHRSVANNSEQLSVRFPWDVLYLNYTFDGNSLFVSKGYFSDRVFLRWNPVANIDNITGYKIFRKELGSLEDSVIVKNLSKDDLDWEDEFANSGVLYKYTVHAIGVHESQAAYMTYIEGIGYRTTSATITGRIAYEGGQAVKGVTVLAESEADFSGTSLSFDGNDFLLHDSLDILQSTQSSLTVEAWMDLDESSFTGSVFDYDGIKIDYDGTNKKLKIKQDGSDVSSYDFGRKNLQGVYVDGFAHFAVVFDQDSLWYYLQGELLDSAKLNSTLSISTEQDLKIGSGIKGYIDEFKIWSKPLDSITISQDYNRYISGGENGLIAYYRMNEGYGDFVYDLSHTGLVFNENHLKRLGATWSDVIPSPKTDLGIRGITDENGNYIISGIPYNGSGSTYTVTPLFEQHSFEPSEKILFLGGNETVINNVDFKDISSFKVTGTVKYKNTSCYAEGVFVLIDGEIVTKDGQPVMTDATGFFELDVPIGYHFITVEKNGHVFSAGRFPSDENEKWNFQEPLPPISFIDSTLVKVVGRVVGGTREGNKLANLGRSTNNIGQAEITFKSQQNNGCSINKVVTDSNTGEYEVLLPPMNYIVEGLSVINDPSIKFGTLDLLNLTRIVPETVIIDTVKNETTGAIISIDSTSYHVRNDYIYRKEPIITVKNTDGSEFSGETSISYDQPRIGQSPLTHTIDLKATPFLYPVFESTNQYTADIRVFETYVNADNPILVDSVPVTDGKVTINNNLAEIQYEEADLNNGLYRYTFTGGVPNTLTNANVEEYSYTQTFEIGVETAKKSITWDVNGEIYRGYVFGGKPNGNNFVTTGPELVDMVLRDPPGSGSYAYIEKGTSDTYYESWTFEGGSTLDLEKKIRLGTTITAGLGVLTKTEVVNDLKLGFEMTMTGGGGHSLETTITFTDTYQTSDGPELVGEAGDLFIGKSMNYIYGTSLNLDVLPDSVCDKPGVECYGESVDGFKIGKKLGMYMVPEGFNTTFVYSKDHIENYLIPDLTQLRNNLFHSENYQLVLTDQNDPKFGTNNDDPIWGTDASSENWRVTDAADTLGKSYIFRSSHLENKYDSVRWYNQQIRIWKDALGENDREKYEAITNGSPERNISFSAGNSYSYTHMNDTINDYTNVFDMAINEEVALEIGASINETGIEVAQSLTFHQVYNKTWGDVSERSKTYGYELYDDNIGDFFSVDVFESTSGGGPIFSTAGGQSMCPWEEVAVVEYPWKKYVTVIDTAYVRGSSNNYDVVIDGKYYKYEITEYQEWQGEYITEHVGKNLSEATMRREIPVLEVAPSVQQNVPDHEAAVFNLTLGNDSQSGDMQWYRLAVLEETNPDGAVLKIDGVPLNRVYAIPGGSSIVKELTVEKGPVKDSYEDIQLVLFSTCEYDNWTNGGVFKSIDTVTISANFIPSCSTVDLLNPEDQWVVNTSFDDTLRVVIGDYNINNPSLEEVQFQYKPSSSSSWIGLQSYFVDTTGMNDDRLKEIPTNASYIIYEWDMAQLPDANYDLRAVSVCTQAESSSKTYSGIYDDTNPHLFGTPQPADGILSPNDDIAVQFNENIDIGKLSWDNFEIKGVLNGSKIRHQASVGFDGVQNYMLVKDGFGLANRTFTIEFWLKRNSLGEQCIFTEGGNASEGLYIGFDANDKLEIGINGEVVKTDKSFTEQDWKHFAIVYDQAESKASVLVDAVYELDVDITEKYTGNGDVYIGKAGFGNSRHFNGFIHEFRIWSTVRTQAKIASKMNTSLGGSEFGLLGNWPMNESRGDVALDKVHSRHGQLNASWNVEPKGRAYQFNGSSDYLALNTARVPMNEEMDMTIEFWFNGQSGAASTFLSNGKGDGTDQSETLWSISASSQGMFFVENAGLKFQATHQSYLDGNWHHFALVVNRLGNISSYIDGELQTADLSENWKGFAAPKLWVGARGWLDGFTENFDNYFNGQMDEVRIWNLARKQSQIKQDMMNRLQGDEIGLKVYLPFEHYTEDVGVLVLTETTENKSQELVEVTEQGGTFSEVPANIKLARPVEKVNFTFAVNEDKVILTPTTDAGLIEKTILDITVKDVYDLRGNKLQSPITWTAYIKKNQVVWDAQQFDLSKHANEELTFRARVINSGGRQESFSIGNLPEWLTATPQSGTLEPDSQQEIIFTVSDGLNIGNYSRDIYLNTDLSFSEKLLINLDVFAERPDWTVNPADFNNSMSLVGYLKVDGLISTDENDMIASKIDGVLTGVGNLEYVPEYDRYMVFLDIYSDYIVNTNQDIELLVWDASTGQIFGDVTPSNLEFEPETMVGTPSVPELIETNNQIVVDMPVNKGWTWLSFNMTSDELKDVEKLMNDLKPGNGDLVRDQYNFATYYTSGDYWYGELGYNYYDYYYRNSFTNYSMYMLRLSHEDTIRFMGVPLSPDTVDIPLKKGWNWISYLPNVNMPLKEALSNLAPSEGDVIKGQKNFAVYDDKLGWIGSLKTLKVRHGYMYKSAKDTQFRYPKSTVLLSRQKEEDSDFACLPDQWEINVHDYEYHMSVIAKVDEDDLSDVDETLLLGAFENKQIRGVARPMFKEDTEEWIYFISLYSNELVTDMSLVLKDCDTEDEYSVNEILSFQTNGIAGTLDQPVNLTIGSRLTSLDDQESSFNAYPNPFAKSVAIELPKNVNGKITVLVHDLAGRRIAEIDTSDFNGDELVWDGTTDSGTEVPAGVYLISVTSGTRNYSIRVTKIAPQGEK
ncbi:LamG-like jellyroll fold domain-containing protein [Aureibacter tunicatorum]|uniref:LamG-like jellyroll fold domain-containing protein n=1 Tax=Aureibacter tunicatorum TaxID=866807 RepID=A0AAE3XND1_9BACT|nr:LamG-like jellyroll fold domain-containing protein [Aureibacter tunicatorum]MDR6239763.1 hypothetical protein [Aureibacter tunicatorum]BDD04238.1 hypothetical protein AUTU_17210 [Aureibacter tunicatorum]